MKMKRILTGMLGAAILAAGVNLLSVQAAENAGVMEYIAATEYIEETEAAEPENAEKQVFETEEDTKTADTGEFTINNGLLTKYTGTAETVTIPSNVRRIGKSAFQNNKYIKSVIIPGNVRKIEILAFYGCSNLESVTMAEGVEEIGMQTFSETHLKSVVLPKSIIKMDRLVFTSCNRLTSIDFTEGTYNINGDIIGSCAALTEIKVSGNNTRYQVKDNVLYEKNGKTVCYCPAGRKTDMNVPDGVEYIGDFAFWDCLTTKVTLPDSVKSIGERAFFSTGMETMILPANLESIGKEAFFYCQNLKQITIPAKTTKIGNNVFGSCDHLETINVAAGNTIYRSEDGILYGTEEGRLVLINCPAGKKGSVKILEGTVGILDGSFSNCEKITSVDMPDSVKSIGEDAFKSCSSLIKVRFSNQLTDIGNYAFYRCDSMQQVHLPDSVKDLGAWAFRYCDALTEVTISKNISDIPDNAFGGCTNLTGITIPDGVKTIADNAFSYCSNLTIYCSSGSAAEKYAKNNNIKRKVTDERKTQTITTDNDNIEKTVGDPDFKITAKTTGDGTLSFYSGNEDIIQVSENGAVKIIGAGTTNIVITASATQNCKMAQTEIYITIKNKETDQKRVQKITYSYQADKKDLNIFYLDAKSDGDGKISYRSENEKIVKIDADGKGYILGSGTVKIIILASETDTCAAAQKIVTLNVEKITDQTDEPGQTQKPDQTEKPGQTDTPNQPDKPSDQNGNATQQKKKQTIKAKNITKTYSTKTFAIGAKSSCGAKLTYKVADKKIAAISKTGKIKLKSYGQTKITIKAAAKGKYKAATKTITLTVKPVKNQITSLKSTKAKTFEVKWKKDKKASGYIIEYSTDKKFKKNVKKNIVSKNKTVSKKITKLKPGKKYYVRVCTYKNSHGKKVQGDYSKVRTVKIRK